MHVCAGFWRLCIGSYINLFKQDIFVINIAYLLSVSFQFMFLEVQMYVFQGTKTIVISCFKIYMTPDNFSWFGIDWDCVFIAQYKCTSTI